jgi:uncharacterized membrane protein
MGGMTVFPDILQITAVVTALGAVLVSGIFFAFSTFVMQALANLPAPQGIAAMQQINVTVLNRLFFSAFFGTAVAAGITLIGGLAGSAGPLPAVGSLFYLVGCILVTMVFNVPLNKALARVDPESDEGARVWQVYLSRWNAWNHVRTVLSLASGAVIASALIWA